MTALQPSASDGGVPAGQRNWMLEHGPRLLDNGHSFIPIIPSSKCPGRFMRSQWTAMHDWPRFCDRPTKTFELGIWKTWPGCGIGIACGRLVALDIDVMDADAVHEIMALALAELGPTDAMRIGMQPKKLLVYRAEKPFQSIVKHPLEIIAHGRQFVAYGTHPITSEPYIWPDAELVDLSLSSLPQVTEVQCRKFLELAYKIVPPEHRQTTLGPDRSSDYYYAHNGELRGNPEAVAQAMEYVPNPDLPYNEWINIGLALFGAVGSAGRDLFAAWSAKSDKDVPAFTLKSWNGIKKVDRIGAGTIYYYAQHEGGWVAPVDLILPASAAERIGPHPAAALLANLPAHTNGHASPEQEPELVSEPDPEPELAQEPDLSHLVLVDQAPGLIGDMTRWILATAYMPQPWLALAASLATIGTVMGRKWRIMPSDTRSNLYILAIAPSGGGKEHPQNCIDAAMVAAGLGELVSMDMRSEAGVFVSAWRCATKLMLIDEIGQFVKVAMHERSSAPHLRAIMALLTKIWSRNKGRMTSGELAIMRDTEKHRIEINQPCLSLYGSTVAEPFWEAMGEGSISDGSISRFLVFEAGGEPSGRCYGDMETMAIRLPDIAAELQTIFVGRQEFNLMSVSDALGRHKPPRQDANPPDPALVSIGFDDDAAQEIEKIKLLQEAERINLSESQGRAVLVRWLEQTMRVALIAAVARGGENVTKDDVLWAAAVTRKCIDDMLANIKKHVAGSEREARLKKFKRTLQGIGRGWFDGSVLARKTQFVDCKTRAEFVQDMSNEGSLEVKPEATKTKPRVWYRVINSR